MSLLVHDTVRSERAFLILSALSPSLPLSLLWYSMLFAGWKPFQPSLQRRRLIKTATAATIGRVAHWRRRERRRQRRRRRRRQWRLFSLTDRVAQKRKYLAEEPRLFTTEDAF